MEIGNWMCMTCRIVLETVDEGQTELCPRCDREMEAVFIEEET